MTVTPKQMTEKGFGLVAARAMIEAIGYWFLTFAGEGDIDVWSNVIC
jgi:hypothetical protein